jgi:hypothetical protein
MTKPQYYKNLKLKDKAKLLDFIMAYYGLWQEPKIANYANTLINKNNACKRQENEIE